MILSEEEKVRLHGLRVILHLRRFRRENPDKKEADKRIPRINWNSGHWADLIDLDAVMTLREPATTCHLSDQEVIDHILNKTTPELPTLPSHS